MALPTGPSVAAGAGAGTGPTVTLLSATDERGIIQVAAGTTPAAGALATVAFSGSWNGYDPVANLTVVVSGCNTNAGALGAVYVSAVSKTAFTVSCTGTPSASTTYQIAYIVAA